MARASSGRLFVAAVVGLVSLAVAVGLVLAGSPGEARRRRLDERRAEDLRALSFAVERYWQRQRRLPGSLEELARDLGVVGANDPVTGKPYDYRVIDARRYELCATFARPSASSDGRRPRWPSDVSWQHPEGRHCFRREARDDRPH